MKRRKFIQSTVGASVVASVLPLTSVKGQIKATLNAEKEKSLYEIRSYEIKFGSNQNLLKDYLKKVLQPALKRVGVSHFLIFKELGESNPTILRVLISYPNASVYMQAQNLNADSNFVTESEAYNKLTPSQAVYNRFSSSLFLAFDGLPKMMDPIEGASLFELRTYEGYSEDAVRRKIKMFNVEELPLFLKTNLHPVFFGEMIIGPNRPCLTYMLNFKDMEERDASWKKFVDHPEWTAMKQKKEYANGVSNIIKIFLKPL